VIGVSVGEEDHLKPAVRLEGTLDLWQVAMKPGKPLAWGWADAPCKTRLPFICRTMREWQAALVGCSACTRR
jgi:molybdopterin biosynthesis enzyme